MLSIWGTASFLAALLAVPAGARSILVDELEQPRGITIETAFPDFVQFAFPCPGCFGDNPAADESLVIPFQVSPTDDISSSNVAVNGQLLIIAWDDFLTENPRKGWATQDTVTLKDSAGIDHSVRFGWIGFIAAPPLSLVVPGYATQTIHFCIRDVDGSPVEPVGFTAIMRPTGNSRHLLTLIPDSTSEIIEFHDTGPRFSILSESDSMVMDNVSEDTGFDLVEELEALGLLEAQAAALHAQIAAKKEIISDHLRRHRENACLRHLLEECDGVICKAKVVVQRIYDKLGITTDPVGYTKLASSHYKNTYLNDHGEKSDFWENTKGAMYESRPTNVPLMLTKDGTTHTLEALDFTEPSNILVRFLEIIAGIFCLSAVWIFIKRKCASARTKAERAADREQRRTERAYRRAARRAEARRRWDNFVNTFTCSRRTPESGIQEFREKREPNKIPLGSFFSAMNCFRVRTDDMKVGNQEEKTNLILQDAFLEQDLDQAEKGEVMEAEIRELRYAHEIVSSLVRVDENRYDLVTPIHDPPPPLVPLPYPQPTVSPPASTYTLPSYTSESLPDYSSRRPSHYRRSSDSTIGFTPSTSDGGDGAVTIVSGSGNSGSSVIDVSPRPSVETLRTRPSGETQIR